MTYQEIIKILKSQANPKNVAGMARFGISAKNTLGISMPYLRNFAKKIGKDHKLALQLWKSGIHEARILAALIDEPDKVTPAQMDNWIKGFDSWDVCDQVCMNLFDKAPFAYKKVVEYAKRQREFEKRTAFALMASLAWHDKKSSDSRFKMFFPIIKKASGDERNFVKKAVNWALRQTGKRNKNLNKLAIKTAKDILKIKSKSAQWIAKDALRELEGEAVQRRLTS